MSRVIMTLNVSINRQNFMAKIFFFKTDFYHCLPAINGYIICIYSFSAN